MSDYKINIFEIAWLSDETIAKFKSDFRYLADYYSQMRKTDKWKPMPGKAKHLKELFDLFSAVTGDTRFIDMYQKSKGEVSDMSCVALDYLIDEYKAKERADERDLAMLDSIRNLMKNVKWTANQAMDALSIPLDERKRYVDKI